MSKVLVITTSLRARSNSDILAGSLFLGGIDAPGEAAEREDALNDAYEFGKALE